MTVDDFLANRNRGKRYPVNIFLRMNEGIESKGKSAGRSTEEANNAWYEPPNTFRLACCTQNENTLGFSPVIGDLG